MHLANMEREDSPEDWLLELLTSHRSETRFAQVCFLGTNHNANTNRIKGKHIFYIFLFGFPPTCPGM